MSVSLIIIAALEREVMPVVRGWRVAPGRYSGAYRSFENDSTLVVCAGIGPRAALRVADAVLGRYKPELLVSAGLAGALAAELQPGQVFTPERVINSGTGQTFATHQGSGTLVSASSVAGLHAKRLLARQYPAQAVDMESAVIAQAAAQHGIPFLAVKAVSDPADFPVPDLEPFIDPHGRFLTARFVAHVALRPSLWSVVNKLRANSALASQQLCAELRNLMNGAWKPSSAAPAQEESRTR
jgi:adenosylhomocysteine nucleosidase